MTIDVAHIIQQSLIELIALLIIPASAVFITSIALLMYRRYLVSKSGISAIDNMSGADFENRLKILFNNLGYTVKKVGNQKGDYGVDLILENNGTKTAVQAKCYKQTLVGESAVREVYAGKNYYHCSKAWVVTNSRFSRMAINLARANNVILINRSALITLLTQEKRGASQTVVSSQP